MNKNKVILSIVILIIIIAIYIGKNVFSSSKKTSKFETIETGSSGYNDVLIELTPKNTKGGKLVVKLSANTHSVELGEFDFMEVVSLKYDGNTIKPVYADNISGHHLSGEIVFEPGREISNFTIIIKGIPSVEERIYTW